MTTRRRVLVGGTRYHILYCCTCHLEITYSRNSTVLLVVRSTSIQVLVAIAVTVTRTVRVKILHVVHV